MLSGTNLWRILREEAERRARFDWFSSGAWLEKHL
jgi:hypothetical protein